jgi:PIN domain nuclease of toxin-antitoxin system
MAASTRLLLDTCAAIWITEDAPLAQEAVDAIDGAFHEGRSIFVSPITAWERGVLVAKGGLASPISPHAWFSRLIVDAGFAVADLSAEILIDFSFLPGAIHSDPADRILVATARAMDLVVVTRDRKILGYADQGHVRALAC